jgi:hypothetical protein
LERGVIISIRGQSEHVENSGKRHRMIHEKVAIVYFARPSTVYC